MPTTQELIAADRGSTYALKRSLEQRFASHVKKAPGCWLWTGTTKDRTGYGYLMVGSRGCRRPVLAHQIALVLDGRPLPEGLVTRHTCHTPACVRPDHLIIGTQAENNADKVPAGRSTYGEKNPAHRLSERDVLAIRRSTEPAAVLAARYGVGVWTVGAARSGRTWRHLPLSQPAPEARR